MTSEHDSPLFVGVDAGGTKTAAWVGDHETIDGLDIRAISEAIGGSANPRVVGFQPAADTIGEVIHQALNDVANDSEGTNQRLARICVAAAGAGRHEEQETLKGMLQKRFPNTRIRVVDDALPVLAAASESITGIALIAGTGSFAWGRNRHGESGRVGGWGPIIGDPGSGYAIALAGLDAVARAIDRRIPPTSMLDAFCHELNLSIPSQIIDRIYDPAMTRRDIAGLSKIVFRAAELGDSSATKILDHAVSELVVHVSSLANRLKLQRGSTLAMTGGILVHQRRLREQLLAALHLFDLKPVVVMNPVAGSLRLAARGSE
ncbi:hypothetical protein LOC67_25380 [Stieleria sp. JC731]|uniref:N-acetylglucosamine kinase n=1 Tax=Pirellulaceae TaxID=2691357 RepID=UPI001E5BB967|nr:BadF/BadG/BcrA/BcrD ATPase family protein [Stieleria sp. JC731]MCC9603898.1 hypothetical protein [Stieleria sp. JC731]